MGAVIAWACVPLLVHSAPDAVAGGFAGAPFPASPPRTSIALGLALYRGHHRPGRVRVRPVARVSACRARGSGSLQQAGRGIVGRRSLARDALVAVQTASALVLLVGAALLMRSVWQLVESTLDDTKGYFTFQVAGGRS